MTEEADIGFSIYYLKANGEKGYLVTPEKIQSHLMMEVGEVNCTRVGTCKSKRCQSHSLKTHLSFGPRCNGI